MATQDHTAASAASNGARKQNNLKGKDARRRLKVRREPHWQDMGKGTALGFRRGPDTWIARWHDASTKKHLYLALKDAVEFDDAMDAASEWWRKISHGASGSVQRGTVLDALKSYIKSKRDHGRNADDIERRVGKTVEGTQLAAIRMEQLTQSAMQGWRTGLREGRANRTVNREVRAVVAGLNWAVRHGGFVGNPLAWMLESLADDLDDDAGDAAVYLTEAQRASLLAACDPDTRAFLHGLEVTGARPGELAAATVADFSGDRLTLRSRKGTGKRRSRSIELSTEGTKFIKAQCRAKLPAAPLFIEPTKGGHWECYQWGRALRYFVQEANKELKGPARIPVAASAYSFRHSSISEMLAAVDPVTVAKHHGTSMAMLEKYYFKFVPTRVRAALDGLKAKPQAQA